MIKMLLNTNVDKAIASSSLELINEKGKELQFKASKVFFENHDGYFSGNIVVLKTISLKRGSIVFIEIATLMSPMVNGIGLVKLTKDTVYENGYNGGYYISDYLCLTNNADNIKKVLVIKEDCEVFLNIHLNVHLNSMEEDCSLQDCSVKIYSKKTSRNTVKDFYYYNNEIVIPYHNYKKVEGNHYAVSDIKFLMNSISIDNIESNRNGLGFTSLDINYMMKNADISSLPLIKEHSIEDDFNGLLEHIVYYDSSKDKIAYKNNNKWTMKTPEEFSLYRNSENKIVTFNRNDLSDRTKLSMIVISDNTNLLIYNFMDIMTSFTAFKSIEEATLGGDESIKGMIMDNWLSLVVMTDISHEKILVKIDVDDYIAISEIVFLWSMGVVEPNGKKPDSDMFNCYINIYQKDEQIINYKMNNAGVAAGEVPELESFKDSMNISKFTYDVSNIIDFSDNIDRIDFNAEIVIELKGVNDFEGELKPVYIPTAFIKGLKIER